MNPLFRSEGHVSESAFPAAAFYPVPGVPLWAKPSGHIPISHSFHTAGTPETAQHFHNRQTVTAESQAGFLQRNVTGKMTDTPRKLQSARFRLKSGAFEKIRKYRNLLGQAGGFLLQWKQTNQEKEHAP